MYVESKEDWIPRDDHRTQWDRNGEGECHDLAKQLSHYLIFLFLSILF